ncbi:MULTISPECIES: 30S ribosomal protein S20 [Dictyoglomus]|jgi:small subunit ribosomal protein S20|uniref:Small ribosomal subunit protein bS20 n=1 Tax=Dictyoglomus turgidum (strain DSM 6724 / Z-1310) TaxID=515635 RepID=RS20_DICTD|nr:MULTISPECIES: 30S ribosomal protein S20 [Dictyoglomus]B8E2A8.1 RecName: Full=Small ribosomal subunit protein bS20; AltName: Full=30S ribosomal protein S20 [Dictyoglomus turgidum DSM 6724]ACK42385.1 ribosomal protein S20 [Dictyoglomus turgidum DSM 6724]PNV79768.1 MAG: 30S ribosomal protein S20 [Dictyoglomus turgidum]HBU32159.1 30S ribosomal protein S20 [Dictyoglomus sp.]
MANTKSAIKRIKISERNRIRNRVRLGKIKFYTKQFLKFLNENNIEEAKKILPEVISAIDKAAQKGTLHKNTAARKKSKLMKLLNQKLSANLSS